MWNSSSQLALTLLWGPKRCGMPSLGVSGSVKSDLVKTFPGWGDFFLLPHTPVFLLADRLLLPKGTSLNKHTLLVEIDKGRWSETEELPPTSLAWGLLLLLLGLESSCPTAMEMTTLLFSSQG